MLSTDNLVGLYFEYGNVMDFWIIGLIVVETEETLAKNIVSWVKNNLENGQYKALWTEALMLILKYTMLAMSLLSQPFGDIYNLTIITIIYSMLIFNLDNLEMESKKYELVCYPS